MSHPEVGRHQRAYSRVLDGRTLLPRQPKSNRVEAEQAIASIAKPLLHPQSVVALQAPGRRSSLVVQVAATVLAVGVELVVGDDFARAVCNVLDARLAVDHPYLLTRRRDLDANIRLRGAHEQTEGVPFAVNPPPVLVRCDRHGRRHGSYPGQKLVAWRVGGVFLRVLGGEAWCEQRAGGKCAYRPEEGATAPGRNHGR